MISAVHSNASVTVFSGRFHKIFICRIGSTRNLSCKIGLDAVRHRVTYRNTVFFKRYREYGSRLIRKNVCEIECIALYAADRERCKFRRCYFIYFSVKRYFRNYSVKIFRFNCYKYFDYFFVYKIERLYSVIGILATVGSVIGKSGVFGGTKCLLLIGKCSVCKIFGIVGEVCLCSSTVIKKIYADSLKFSVAGLRKSVIAISCYRVRILFSFINFALTSSAG